VADNWQINFRKFAVNRFLPCFPCPLALVGPAPGCGQKLSGCEKWNTLLDHIFQALACSEA
jgi:hypothetical protein